MVVRALVWSCSAVLEGREAMVVRALVAEFRVVEFVGLSTGGRWRGRACRPRPEAFG
jgi:hypothetical protein